MRIGTIGKFNICINANALKYCICWRCLFDFLKGNCVSLSLLIKVFL